MKAPITKPPKTTVFSIDPTTNQPYITVNEATKVILKHIHLTGKNILQHNDVEDVTQSILTRACQSAYNPDKSAPTTFIILMASSQLGRLFNRRQWKDRYLEIPDFIVGQEDDGPMCTEMAVDNLTPETILDVKQQVILTTENKRCKACGEMKPLEHFYKNGRGRRALTCINCIKKARKNARKAKV